MKKLLILFFILPAILLFITQSPAQEPLMYGWENNNIKAADVYVESLYVDDVVVSGTAIADSVSQAITDSLAARIVTTVGDPGDDASIPSEQAVREALAGLSQAAVKVDSLILRKDDTTYGTAMTYDELKGTKIETF